MKGTGQKRFFFGALACARDRGGVEEAKKKDGQVLLEGGGSTGPTHKIRRRTERGKRMDSF